MDINKCSFLRNGAFCNIDVLGCCFQYVPDTKYIHGKNVGTKSIIRIVDQRKVNYYAKK